MALLAAVLAAGCGRGEEAPLEEPPIGTEAGMRPPALTGSLAAGGEYTLPAEPGAPHVIVFLRGADCGLCRVRLERLRQRLPEYAETGAQIVVAVPAGSAAFPAADEGGLTLVRVPPRVLEQWEVARDDTPPLPAAYIVDSGGTIAFRHVGRNAGDRVPDTELLAVLATLQ